MAKTEFIVLLSKKSGGERGRRGGRKERGEERGRGGKDLLRHIHAFWIQLCELILSSLLTSGFYIAMGLKRLDWERWNY